MLVHTGRQGSQAAQARASCGPPPQASTRESGAQRAQLAASSEAGIRDPGSTATPSLVSVTFLVLDDSDTPGPNWQTSCVHDINAA